MHTFVAKKHFPAGETHSRSLFHIYARYNRKGCLNGGPYTAPIDAAGRIHYKTYYLFKIRTTFIPVDAPCVGLLLPHGNILQISPTARKISPCRIISGRCVEIAMEGFIKVARVAVAEHVGDHLDREFRVFK